ncbi:MAG: hypothetical protein A2539_04670 [Elusimicrobia bacterium RIFOXYD2_FULL_34_15]|nr:MAG: hypothetical protein A2539_04670 [Elusimicrobia bacterium RIFOXYD2_FULL_34_15]
MKEFVSIILPAHNEEEALGTDIDLIRKTMKEANIDYELIVVDDGSKDRTAEIAKQKGAILIQHKVNRGVGAARKTGILNAKSNIVITTDADATYPNQDIPKLLEYIGEYDMVIGARIGENAIKESLIRRIPKFLIRKLASYMSRTKIPDLNSGLRVIRKDVALKYFYLLPDSHSWESTITLAFLCNGQQVKFIPIDYYKRKGKSTFHPINDTYNYIFLTIRTIMYFNPLRIFLPVSLLVLLIGLAKGTYDFIMFNSLGEFDVLAIIAAILIVMMGLLADLIVIQHKK